jgi:putative ABC transport system permease protein
MLKPSDTWSLSVDALRAHKLRALLTILGLTMGVATLITVVTIIQGANVCVENKIATLGSDVFQVARTPFATTDWTMYIKAQKYRRIQMDDYEAFRDHCPQCVQTGAQGTMRTKARLGNIEVADVSMTGQTPSMVDIESRTLEGGRYFTETENSRGMHVAMIGDTLREKVFSGQDPLGQTIRLANQEFLVIGYFERVGSVLGQDADSFAVVPLNTFLAIRGSRYSLTVNVRVPHDEARLDRAMDQTRLFFRTRHKLQPTQEDDFFFGTKDSYIALWNSISGAFFSVFILVSSISALVGGIVIMNVMLVSVTERTKEIGIRRAVGASSNDILRQFLAEAVIQCLCGGAAGILAGFFCASMLRRFTSFPASVQGQVAMLGLVLSSVIGLFFGIYPASRASSLDPVEALRAE